MLAQLAGSSVTAVISLALMVLLGRAMGPAAFGDFVAWLALATLGLILIEGGWPTLVYRETVAVAGQAPARAERLAGQALRHLTLCGSALAALAWLAGFAALAAALECMTLVAAMNLASARLRGAGRFGAEAAWQVAGRIASAGAIVAAVWSCRATPTLVFLAWAAGLAVVLVLGAARLPSPFIAAGRAGYALALPFVVLDGLSALMFKSDVAVLKLFALAPGALSDYAACTRFNEAALLLGAPFANVMLRVARQRAGDADAYRRFAARAAAGAALAGLLMWLGACVFGEPLVRLLFGAGFDGALLGWTAAALVFALPSLVLVPVLIAGDDERRVLLALLLAGVLLPIAMGVGLSQAGVRGAAVGLLLAHALLAAGLLSILARRTRG